MSFRSPLDYIGVGHGHFVTVALIALSSWLFRPIRSWGIPPSAATQVPTRTASFTLGPTTTTSMKITVKNIGDVILSSDTGYEKWLKKKGIQCLLFKGAEVASFEDLLDGGAYTLGPPQQQEQTANLAQEVAQLKDSQRKLQFQLMQTSTRLAAYSDDILSDAFDKAEVTVIWLPSLHTSQSWEGLVEGYEQSYWDMFKTVDKKRTETKSIQPAVDKLQEFLNKVRMP